MTEDNGRHLRPVAAAEPETLAGLLDEVRAALRRYVILPNESAYVAVTLWIGATHVQDAWEHAPRLVVKAPEKRCGKSRLLDVIEATSHKPLMSVHASAASIYRAIGAAGPTSLTLLVDEADALFGPKTASENEDLRGLLNAGHQRNRRVPRWNANLNKLELLETFAMAALAGIGNMPDTIEDRSVIIHMRRRMAGEEVASFRQRRDAVPLHDLRDRLAGHLREYTEALTAAIPDMPVEDRAGDTWEPLIALAELAGDAWLKAGLAAAVELTSSADATAEQSTQLRLLSDCRDVLQGVTGMGSTKLVEKLKAIEDAGWDTYGSAGLTPKRLVQLLRVYGISPANEGKNVRWPDGGGTSKGYFTEAFRDAWARYLPPLTGPSEQDGEGYPAQPSQATAAEQTSWSEAELPCDGSEPCDGSSVTATGTVTPRKGPLTSRNADRVTGVTGVTGAPRGTALAPLCEACGEACVTQFHGQWLHPTCEAS